MAAAPKRTGLGRGIGALIPTSDDTTDRPVDVFFPAGTRRPARACSRCPALGSRASTRTTSSRTRSSRGTSSTRTSSQELVVSIREFGVLQPIVVRPRAGAVAGEPQYELIMGERRLRATKLAGLATIPAVVKNTADEDMLRDALLENLHRAQLNPLEEASRLPATARGLRDHAGAARRAHRPLAPADHQHDPPAAPAGADAAQGGRRRPDRGSRACDPRRWRRRKRWSAWPTRSSTRTCPCARPRPLPGWSSTKRAALRQAAAGKRQGQLDEIAERLGDRLNTRVKITLGASKGTIVIDFATVGDLNRILGELGEPGYE